MQDTPKLRGLREELIELMDTRIGLTDSIKKAFMEVPRHYFTEKGLEELSYQNKALRIGQGQTISHPLTVAYQTQLLDVKQGDKILEIGTGSGFQACILANLGAEVYSIERHAILSHRAKEIIDFLGLKIHLFIGDGSKGLPEYGLYDKIIITAATPDILPILLRQLTSDYGILVAPVGDLESQVMKRYIKHPEGRVEEQSFDSFKFVPLIGDYGFNG
jgi:protein-L-isoaspartate(D-aspartate) O-methyltransferase